MKHKATRIVLVGALLAGVAGVSGCHRHKQSPVDLSDSQEPDKILYERSVEDIQKKRFNVARLTLQTLINTYPDSDYLADAKLAIADSYYAEGTTASLTHAEIEYKDFVTFFPNLPQVPYAQYRAALCHYQRLEKPDRDRTYARRAEEEFQRLLRNYPDSEYAAEGEKKLIQVQEVLGEGEFRIGRFYYMRESWRASASRLADLVERYPNYSKRDHALWMLAQSFEHSVPYLWPGDPARAAEYYARLIREHPLSDYLGDARAQLARLGQPIPEPDPVLLARAQAVQPVVTEEEEKRSLLGHLFGVFSGRPKMSTAAPRLGPPPLEPPKEQPKLPPPVFRAGRTESTVTVQTVEDLPAGTQVKPASGASNPGDNAASDDPNRKDGNQSAAAKEPSRRKKSFWRKLVPFW
ncbi:MAG: outer membrane protein assembly factor BamD [Terriglobia bacterium]